MNIGVNNGQSRLHKEAVIAGTEKPYRQPTVNAQVFRCKCNELVGETMAREHIRKCWKYNIKDDDPIPNDLPGNV